MKIFLLLWLCVAWGYLLGWGSCAARHRRKQEVDKTLADYAKYQQQRDVEYPEMIGKWGKP